MLVAIASGSRILLTLNRQTSVRFSDSNYSITHFTRSAQKLALPTILRIACAFSFALASAPALMINASSFLIQQLVMAPVRATLLS
jgi:hypothetical protein